MLYGVLLCPCCISQLYPPLNLCAGLFESLFLLSDDDQARFQLVNLYDALRVGIQ